MTTHFPGLLQKILLNNCRNKGKINTPRYLLSFNLKHFVENTPKIAPNPCFVIMDPSVLSLKKTRERKRVVSEKYGNHSNEVNPPLKL
jgi:hypothetical protein